MVDSTIFSPQLFGIIATILSFVIGLLAKHPQYQKVKSKISQSKEFLTQIDDALYDPKVTDEEFRKIFDAGKKLIDRNDA